MNKMKKLKIKLLIAIGVICFVSVLAIGTVAVYAYNSYSDTAKIVNEAGVTFNYNEAQLQPQDQEDFLSGASPVKTNRQFFTAGYQSGGERYATTTDATTYTLVSAEFNGNTTYIDWNTGINTTLTTMATTSMGFMGIPYVGDERSYWFRSATTTAATTITFAAGTGVDLQKNEDTADLAVNGLDVAKLTFIRKADTDVLLIMTEYIEAD